MNAHCFQHEPFEGMAAIETWLTQNNFDITYTRFYESDVLPDLNHIDWLIVMGGSMSVNDESDFPWLKKEKVFIKNCINSNKVVIGVCLGSQLIANALGAIVYKNTEKEIGWYPIFKNKNVYSPIFDSLPQETAMFHWHGETYDLPEGAKLIASSKVCKNQIFQVREKTIAFQCHPETTLESLRSMNEACRAELVQASFIQSEAEMIAGVKEYAPTMHNQLFKILDNVKNYKQ